MENLTYIGTYKVYKIFRKSRRREILARGLTREEAKSMVMRYKYTFYLYAWVYKVAELSYYFALTVLWY